MKINLSNKKGWEFECKISGTPAKGKIQIEKNRIYLCQNEKDGDYVSDKLGYRYSWCIDAGDERGFNINSITDFKLIIPHPEKYKDWQVGDKLSWNRDIYQVIFRSEELVICKNIEDNCSTGNYTCDELFDKGGRLIVEEEENPEIKITELTLEEVAVLAKIPVEQLRIKEK